MKSEKTVTVSVAQLLDKIKENKQKHIEEYQRLVDEQSERLKEMLDSITKELLEFGHIRNRYESPILKDNTKHYDNLIEMYEWEVNKEVELTESEFKRVVLDQTGWFSPLDEKPYL